MAEEWYLIHTHCNKRLLPSVNVIKGESYE
ncbi:hypothetical protein LCGC14_0849580 [marine sediment metagenome]|uniref:Uncharacterized protein n=1 Tax=marine sediment metagenome TaxID=412755 RepID=A0A0F9PAR6_9ZZZZ